MSTPFPYDRSALLTVDNPDFVADLESFVGGLWRSDTRHGDATMFLLDAAGPFKQRKATVVAKADGFFSGIPIVEWFFERMRFKSSLTFQVGEGAAFKAGKVLLRLQGPAKEILKLERTLLNVLQRLCGITTQTRKYVDVARPTRLAATRKTQWGLVDKYAVAIGGGLTHRLDLGDALLFKENHLRLLKDPGAFWDSLFSTLPPETPFVTIEVETLQEAKFLRTHFSSPLPCPVFLMFDNFSVFQLKKALNSFPKIHNLYFEASGGIHLKNISKYAQTGVDVLSVGALTHSVSALDLSLLLS
jgi:nicotinate-nucleotide pyrophosphorylase (carboxylating)